MKKNIIILFCLCLFVQLSYALPKSRKVFLNVVLDSISQPYFLKTPLHIQKKIKFDAHQSGSMVVGAQSEVSHENAKTVAVLVNTPQISDEEVTLHFQILQYSYNRKGSILARSKIVLRNGQMGEIIFDKLQLRVTANWS